MREVFARRKLKLRIGDKMGGSPIKYLLEGPCNDGSFGNYRTEEDIAKDYSKSIANNLYSIKNALSCSQIKWCCESIKGFKDMYEHTEKRKADEAEYKKGNMSHRNADD